MSTAWIQFIIVILGQTIVFYASAYLLKEKPKTSYLTLGALLGIPIGLFFDLYAGEYLGIYSYELGFTYPFLFFNWLLSWGIFIATVFLYRNLSALHLLIPAILLAVAYELVNSLSPVWDWTFGTTAWIEYAYMIPVAYPGLAVVTVGVLHILRLETFILVHNKTGDK